MKPEVLAPAGNEECLEAAIRAGADAVYFGIPGLNARARAGNFELNQLEPTMRRLHRHGVRGYVAMNTLVFDDELERVEEAIRVCARAGVDALIVQDIGLATLSREIAPDLPLHASTQMTCTDAGSVRFAAELGIERVVLARELSLAEIESIARAVPEIELEVFVHGALCIAYSGQCLTSEALGGRSANRGACAQACRLPYELIVDGVARDLGDKNFLLSPRDLEASAEVAELARVGVRSLKIEGRLKGPEYVAATTRLYRAALDGSSDLEERKLDAESVYSRGSSAGFLGGVDHQSLVDGRNCDHVGQWVGTCLGTERIGERTWIRLDLARELRNGDGILIEGSKNAPEVGGRVWEIQDNLIWLGAKTDVSRAARNARVHRTNDPVRERAIRLENERGAHRVALDIEIAGEPGQPLRLHGRSERGASAIVWTDTPLIHAERHPLDVERIRGQLARLGETPFELRTLCLDMPPESMLPISSLNRARRALVDALIAQSHHEWPTTLVPEATRVPEASRLPVSALPEATPPPGLLVLCRTLEQAQAAAAAGADGIILDFLELTGTGEAFRALRARGVMLVVAPPRIRKPGEEKIDRFLRSLGPDAILVRGLGALHESSSIPKIGDFSLNITNRRSAHVALSKGLAAFTPSYDLNALQLLHLLDSSIAPFAEVVVHQPMPLFHMEHCVIAALLSEGRDHKSCGRPCEAHRVSLRDREGMDHPVEADVGCRNTVFHARSQSAATVIPQLRDRGVGRFRIELVRETATDVGRIVSIYRDLICGRIDSKAALKSLEISSGYGVVSGSLKVIRSPR